MAYKQHCAYPVAKRWKQWRYGKCVFLKQNKSAMAIRFTVGVGVQVYYYRYLLSVAVYTNIHLPPVDLGSIHHPASLLGALWRVEPHRPTTLRFPVLHLDLGKHHLTCRTHQDTPEIGCVIT